MADVAHLDAPADQLVPGGHDVVDHQVGAPVGAGDGVGDPPADGDRAGRAGRGHLDDPELVADVVVDVEAEAEVVDVERLGPVDVGDGDEDKLEAEVDAHRSTSPGVTLVMAPAAVDDRRLP